MQFKNFTLDDFQEQAIYAVQKNNSVIVSAPTGSGKTLIADYIIDQELKGDKRVIYTAPIKALSNQKYKDFCEDYGEDNIGLITGDIVINSSAKVLIMTTEVYRNMAIINDPVLDDVSYCIMDEIHYIGDFERGYVWEESIIFSSNDVRFLFLSATIPNSAEFASWVETIKEHKVEIVEYHHRPVPLDIRFFDSDLGICSLEDIKKRKKLDDYPDYRSRHSRRHSTKRANVTPPDYRDLVKELANKDQMPCLFFVFSRLKTQEYASKLAKKNDYLSSSEKKRVAEIVSAEVQKMSSQILNLRSVSELRQCLSKGIAFHHAGLVPDTKHIVELLFTEGLIKVLFTTETFAVGINMPAKSVCFNSLRKYTSEGFRYLNSKEFFQISGRAGRRGIDKKGLSVSMIHRRMDDIDKIAYFTKDDSLPIKSQFRLSYNTVLNMINQHSPKEIEEILKKNLYTFQELKGRVADRRMLGTIKARYTKAVKTLRKLGYIEEDRLTDLGMFTTKIYADEIEISQVFHQGLGMELDEYSIILILASLIYEGKRMTRFFKKYPNEQMYSLRKVLKSHPVLGRQKWIANMINMTAIVQPLFEQKTFTEILKNTNLLEGDIIRILMQVMDRLEQIDKASFDHELQRKVRGCKDIIRHCLEGINVL